MTTKTLMGDYMDRNTKRTFVTNKRADVPEATLLEGCAKEPMYKRREMVNGIRADIPYDAAYSLDERLEGDY